MGEKWVRSTAPAGAASVPQSLTAAEAALDRASGGGRAPGGAGPAAGDGAEGRGAGDPLSHLLRGLLHPGDGVPAGDQPDGGHPTLPRAEYIKTYITKNFLLLKLIIEQIDKRPWEILLPGAPLCAYR